MLARARNSSPFQWPLGRISASRPPGAPAPATGARGLGPSRNPKHNGARRSQTSCCWPKLPRARLPAESPRGSAARRLGRCSARAAASAIGCASRPRLDWRLMRALAASQQPALPGRQLGGSRALELKRSKTARELQPPAAERVGYVNTGAR